MKRWPPLIGGVLLNLALGAFYAWSVTESLVRAGMACLYEVYP